MFAKALLSAVVVLLQELANDTRAAMDVREVREQYAKLGMEPGTLFLNDFAKFVRTEMSKYQQARETRGHRTDVR